ncbi:glycosyltransferase family 9 protein [bacterium]|nr:glycosyltransferase family 9 protein [bacterium]
MEKPYKILVIRTDKIGDVVLSLPVISELRRVCPDSQLTMLVNPAVRDIVESSVDIDSILYDTGDENSINGFRNFVHMLKKESFDAAILLHPSLMLSAAIYMAHIPVRAGTGYRLYSFLFNRGVFEHRKKSGRHEAELNLSLARAICPAVDVNRIRFLLEVDDDSLRSVRTKLNAEGVDGKKPFIIVHPGSKGSALTWPEHKFHDFVAIFADNFPIQILVTGLSEEEAVVKNVSAGSDFAFNLAGVFDLKELMGLIKMSKLLIANSTGPLHIAAALGTPVIGLYPPVVPMSVKRWGPYTDVKKIFVPDTGRECEKCTGAKCEFWNCMEMIKAEDVADSAAELLKRTGVHK